MEWVGMRFLVAVDESKEADRLALVLVVDDVVVAVDRVAGVCIVDVEARNLVGLDLSMPTCTAAGFSGETVLAVLLLLFLFWCLCAVGGVDSCAVFGCVSVC